MINPRSRIRLKIVEIDYEIYVHNFPMIFSTILPSMASVECNVKLTCVMFLE